MDNNFEGFIAKRMTPNDPPDALLGHILATIDSRRIRSARLRFGLFSGTALVSIILLVPAIQYFISEFYGSGFYNYISILITDGGSVLTYWQDWSLAVIDSFPIMALTSVFTAVFTILGSIRNLARDVRSVFSPVRFAA